MILTSSRSRTGAGSLSPIPPYRTPSAPRADSATKVLGSRCGCPRDLRSCDAPTRAELACAPGALPSQACVHAPARHSRSGVRSRRGPQSQALDCGADLRRFESVDSACDRSLARKTVQRSHRRCTEFLFHAFEAGHPRADRHGDASGCSGLCTSLVHSMASYSRRSCTASASRCDDRTVARDRLRASTFDSGAYRSSWQRTDTGSLELSTRVENLGGALRMILA